jgi:hypothetical protein
MREGRGEKKMQNRKHMSKNEQTIQTKRRRQIKTKWAERKSSPLIKLYYLIIQKTPNTEIPKRNFSLLSNPLQKDL